MMRTVDPLSKAGLNCALLPAIQSNCVINRDHLRSFETPNSTSQ